MRTKEEIRVALCEVMNEAASAGIPMIYAIQIDKQGYVAHTGDTATLIGLARVLVINTEGLLDPKQQPLDPK